MNVEILSFKIMLLTLIRKWNYITQVFFNMYVDLLEFVFFVYTIFQSNRGNLHDISYSILITIILIICYPHIN